MSTSLYDYLFVELADPRVNDWPFMSNPWKICGLIGFYLYMIYVYLPSYMADKKPYSLKGIIAVYNVFQVFACSTIIYGMATSGWTTHYRIIGCEPVDFSESEMAVRMAKFMWWNMMLKIVDLFETVLFVLRKKFTQVSFLHVYHHVSTLTMAWLVCKYFPGGLLTFTPMINSLVHIFMYTYYFLAAMSPGPQLQKTLTWIKPKLTMVQLVQLVIIIVQNMQLFLPGCGIHNVVGFIFLPNVCVNVIFFLNFYTKSYRNKNVSKTN
ncbi:elongation of very long chain fatty acids protein-like isoform X2 [Photinus pyralis]|uniref:Elongation of very long chain fatty acids protein n=2 Tax=Photinus pyralis TaxID=7054 RepID=A0A1Y1N2Y2_PHOPY|nr:elongation of very long chain fatty acids protein-like isoform X2 [Photinus pyralis]XP_031329032.1 elongation of very long chain fatty acids protein-like isoform X2 [Photinus pyralis]XP_031329033.1 elongation of very long chain fatty acids protein-like isoform X2 [Photinus pyralis]